MTEDLRRLCQALLIAANAHIWATQDMKRAIEAALRTPAIDDLKKDLDDMIQANQRIKRIAEAELKMPAVPESLREIVDRHERVLMDLIRQLKELGGKQDGGTETP
jgi:hypothetical protein